MASVFSKILQSIRRQAPVNQSPLRLAYDQPRQPQNRHSVCYAPSVNMLFATDGTVKACCHNSENTLGRYPEQSIAEIWNSQLAKDFRQRTSNYEFLSGCTGCATDYAEGHFEHMPARHFDSLPRHTQYPTMMEFLLSNVCNLECIMCSGELSSSIRQNREHLPTIQSPYDRAFVEQLREFIPHLHETRFSGAGEAFSINMNYELWNLLIEKNKHCLIVVQTNGTVLNARVKDYLHRGNFQIGVSLDSLQKETYEAIRIHASFERVMQNIEYFAQYSREHNKVFTISACVMRQNWQELPQFVAYCNALGAHLILHKVWSPLSCALYNLPAAELEHIYNTLSPVKFPETNTLEKRNAAIYHYLTEVIARWLKEAKQKEQNGVRWQHLTNEELQQQVKVNLENYILQQTILETDKGKLIALCHDKLDRVMDLWTDEKGKRTTLIKLCTIPVAEILIQLKAQPVEKLFEMSNTSNR